MGDMSLGNTVGPIRYVLSLTLALRDQVKVVQLSSGDAGVIILWAD